MVFPSFSIILTVQNAALQCVLGLTLWLQTMIFNWLMKHFKKQKWRKRSNLSSRQDRHPPAFISFREWFRILDINIWNRIFQIWTRNIIAFIFLRRIFQEVVVKIKKLRKMLDIYPENFHIVNTFISCSISYPSVKLGLLNSRLFFQ